jgi:SAM-dependent methyltransferase
LTKGGTTLTTLDEGTSAYWRSQYDNLLVPGSPSGFAIFCYSHFGAQTDVSLIDLGCGNGRDAAYFSSFFPEVIGIDASAAALSAATQLGSERGQSFKLLEADFAEENFDSLTPSAYILYSRFTLHSLSAVQEAKFFSRISGQSRALYLCIETRSVGDGLYGIGEKVDENAYFSDHFRRFSVPDELRNKLSDLGKIEIFEENTGFAPLGTDNPMLIRAIVKLGS